jgi:hypothetical protein
MHLIGLKETRGASQSLKVILLFKGAVDEQAIDIRCNSITKQSIDRLNVGFMFFPAI